MIKITAASSTDILDYPDDWPDKERFVNQHAVRRNQFEGLKDLIERRSGETTIENFLSSNPEVVALVTSLFSTGHHGVWLYPKLHIRPPSVASGGLIPDYMIGAKNSGGFSWFALELKGANDQAFRKRGHKASLSKQANRGVCQLLDYVDASAETQGYLRDQLHLTGFREPRGILLIGTESESEDKRLEAFKGAWNRINQRLEIRSYSALLRVIEQKLRDFGR